MGDTVELITEALKTFITDLRQDGASQGLLRPGAQAEKELFLRLDFIGQKPDEQKKRALENCDVVLETFPLTTQMERIEYKRVTTVFNRKMYNKFFVPIWAAAMDSDREIGYAVYPKLTCVKDLIEGIPKETRNEVFIKDVRKVLRHCVVPVALALDALHTPLPGKRTMYYHRELSIDDVYVCTEKKSNRYGDAMVKFTKLSRGSHTEYINPSKSGKTPSSSALFSNYFYNQNLSGWPGAHYHRKHDWYSFGVYILEVMHLLLHGRGNFREIAAYDVYVDEFEADLRESPELRSVMPYLSIYLRVAKECLKLDAPKERMSRHPVARAVLDEPFNSSDSDWQFEYDVTDWTALLLWLYKETYEEPCCWPTTSLPGNDAIQVCGACLLRPIGGIPSAVHLKDDNLQCDDDCLNYCFSCYTNGERQFCPNQHGTVSPLIGHHSSYALILYGTDQDAETAASFKWDALMLQKTMTHKLICGIPEKQVVCAPVFDADGEGKSAEQVLEQQCHKMARVIHGESSNTCTNSATYTVFIFYSGHGHNENKENKGNWCPLGVHECPGVVITKDVISTHLELLLKCSNENKPACDAVCVEVIRVLDHCYPSPDSFGENQDRSAYVAAKPGTKSKGVEGNTSEISTWFSLLMRSCYFIECSRGSQQKCWSCIEESSDCCKHVNCVASSGNSDACTRIRRSIRDTDDKFITGRSLKCHQAHMNTNHLYKTSLIVNIPTYDEDLRLAYYNPNGVYLRVFNLKEDGQSVEIDFHCEMTYQGVAEAVLKELSARKNNKSGICLLTSHSSDYSKYELVSNCNINHKLDSEVLFYSYSTEIVQVTLEMEEGNEQKVEKVTLPLTAKDLKSMMWQLENTYARESVLPNITAYIVHHLRHKQFYSNKDTQTTLPAEPNQPQETVEATDAGNTKHAVFRNFLEVIGDESLGDRDLYKLDDKEWTHVAAKANAYVDKLDKHFRVVADECKLKWKRKEFSLRDVTPTRGASNDSTSAEFKPVQPASDHTEDVNSGMQVSADAEDDDSGMQVSTDTTEDSLPQAPSQL